MTFGVGWNWMFPTATQTELGTPRQLAQLVVDQWEQAGRGVWLAARGGLQHLGQGSGGSGGHTDSSIFATHAAAASQIAS